MYEDIKEQFRDVIIYSQGIPDPDIDELFDRWLEAKRDIIEAFDGRLVWTYPYKVHFKLDESEKTARFNEFIESITNTYRNYALADFLDANADGFYANSVTHEFSQDNIKVPRGMKLVKAFKFFEKDPSLLDYYQTRASQVIQEDKIEGTLCFSVHPLDFLSTSMNTHNWRSCHSLDGEYRSGNLSYMMDKSTIVCYLKSDDDVVLPLFPENVLWNSKKWRCLIYLSENWDMLFAGRQYPFSSKPALDMTKDKLLGALKQDPGRFSAWHDDYVDEVPCENGDVTELSDMYFPRRGALLALGSVVKDAQGALQFNDLLRSSCYQYPYYSIRDNQSWYEGYGALPEVTVGASVKCLHCGKHWITNPETMMCDDCELQYGHEENEIYGTCDCCGARIIRDEATSVGYYDMVCDNCYNTQCFICDCCDEVCYNTDKVYDSRHEDYVCKRCYEERQEED